MNIPPMRGPRAASRWGAGQQTWCSQRCKVMHYSRRWHVNAPHTNDTGMGNPHKARAVAEYIKMMEAVHDIDQKPDTLIV